MSALGPSFRFVVDNRSGVALAAGGVVIKYKRSKFDSSGTWTPETTEQTVTVGTSLANGTSATSSAIDNASSGLYHLMMDMRLEYAGLASSSTGTVAVYLQTSTDGGTTWPDSTTNAVQGRLVNAMSWSASSAAQKGWAQVR